MGQAKNRGNREERIAHLLEEQSQKVDEVRKSLELPDDARFCGFLVYAAAAKKFLQQTDDARTAARRAYGDAPDLGYRFETFLAAFKQARTEHGESVVGLFDLGDRLVVAQLMP